LLIFEYPEVQAFLGKEVRIRRGVIVFDPYQQKQSPANLGNCFTGYQYLSVTYSLSYYPHSGKKGLIGDWDFVVQCPDSGEK
jgi:hypothetical protein